MKWISVKDRLPKIEEKCLFFLKEHKAIVNGTFVKSEWTDELFFDDYASEYDFGIDLVSHWMPLPKPPEE